MDNDPPLSAAIRAGGADGKKAVGSAYLTSPVTVGAYLRFRARLCTAAMTLLTSPPLEDLDLRLPAESGIGQGYLEIVPEVGAGACTPAGGTRGKAEEILEDVAE
jgi:hypothetical protein